MALSARSDGENHFFKALFAQLFYGSNLRIKLHVDSERLNQGNVPFHIGVIYAEFRNIFNY